MNKLLSRLILGFTALSAVFFTSPVFAFTASDGSVYTIGHTNNSRVFDGSGSAIYCSRGGWSNSQMNSGSNCISNVNATYDYASAPISKYDSYYTQRYSIRPVSGFSYDLLTIQCKNGTGSSWYKEINFIGLKPSTLPDVSMYGNYMKIVYHWYYNDSLRTVFYRASDCVEISESQALDLPPFVPSGSCTSDTITTGGDCSCKNTGTYTASASGAVKMPWTYDGIDISSSLSFSIEQQSFASTKTDYVALKYTPSGSFKAPRIMGKVDMSGITGTKVDPIMFNNLGTTGSLAPYSGSGIQNPTTTASNAIYIDTYDGDNIDSLISSPFGDNSSDDPDNLFNSFYIHATTGYPSSRHFDAYYSDIFNSNSLNPLDLKWEFLGTFSANQYVNLPYGKKTRKIKIVPRTTNVYYSAVSLWNVSFIPDKVCSVLSGDALTAEIASRSTLSGSTNIANVNFCSSSFDVPYIGSALGAMCNFVQPLIKPLVGGFQTTVDMINIVPPSTAPTTFDYYPSFTFSGMTMHISTQTGAIPVYSSGSDVNPLKITSNEASSNMKIGVLALISIILYLVVYALHFGIVAGLVWLLLHISRFFTGFLGKHSGTGNIWSLAPFLVYAGVFFTALLSIIASVSFILPLLQVIRAYALFLITWLTSFAPGSYALFSGFYLVVFSSIFLVGTFYLIHVLFEKHSRLN